MLKKKGGLGSLIPGSELGNDSDVKMVAVDAITANPYQPRAHFDAAEISELADSIRTFGIIQPLTVRKTAQGYELVAGERRLQASIKAELREVPVIVRECTEQEMLSLALIENIQRSDLNAVETAVSYKRLQDEFGLTQQEIATQVGKSRSSVANTLRLLDLPNDILEALSGGKISEGHGKLLLSATDSVIQTRLYNEILTEKLSVRDLEKRLNSIKSASVDAPLPIKAKKSAKKEKIDPNLAQIKRELEVSLSTRVTFRAGSDDNAGTVEIEYFSAADLENIYSKLLS